MQQAKLRLSGKIYHEALKIEHKIYVLRHSLIFECFSLTHDH